MRNRNITLSLDKTLLNRAQQLARRRGLSLNGLIRDFLRAQVGDQSGHWLREFEQAMEDIKGDSGGRRWKRQDLYDR